MPYIAAYLLKLSVSLCVVYLFYILVLRRLTFYNWNRWYLVGYSLLAFYIPFINISPVLEESNWDKYTFIQLIPMLQQPVRTNLPPEAFAWWTFLLAGALIGVMVMMVRFMIRYISYQRIRQSANLMVDAGVKVYHVDKSIIPFSFGNAIFINPQLHSEEDLKQIIHHEFIHVKQRHTIDILWGELLCMLNWYNPFAWMIRKAIRQNLEFIADHKVLENGIDKKHYQYLLLKVTGAAHFSITQQFNFSSLKKRIIMMNRSRSAKIQLTRFLFMLPLFTITLLAFRSNVIEQNHRKATASAGTGSLVPVDQPQVVDTFPSKESLTWDNFLKKNPSVKKLSIEKSIDDSGKISPVMVVYKKDGTEERYNWSKAEDVALLKKRYGFFPKFPEIPEEIEEKKRSIKITADTLELVDASRNGPGNPYVRSQLKDVLWVLNGVVQTDEQKMYEIDPNTIESISVLKDADAVKAYGDKVKGKQGVIEVKTKSKEAKANTVILDAIAREGIPTIKIGTPNKVALYIVDEVEYTYDEFIKLNLDPNLIESIGVFKNDPATNKYGEKGKNGVIVIKTKRPVTLRENEPSEINEIINASDNPIHIIHGNTYAVSGSGSMATTNAIINKVIVDDKIYTVEEANRLFKKGEFTGVGVIDAATVQRVHGKNEPAMILGRKGFNWDKYNSLKNTSVQ